MGKQGCDKWLPNPYHSGSLQSEELANGYVAPASSLNIPVILLNTTLLLSFLAFDKRPFFCTKWETYGRCVVCCDFSRSCLSH